MAYYQTNSYTTTGTKGSINLDPAIAPFCCTVACILEGAATGTFSMQYSLSPMDVTDANALWLTSGDIPLATATNASSFIQSPVSRVRLVIAAVSGTLTIQTLQGLSTN